MPRINFLAFFEFMFSTVRLEEIHQKEYPIRYIKNEECQDILLGFQRESKPYFLV